jgi:hypothetical protein
VTSLAPRWLLVVPRLTPKLVCRLKEICKEDICGSLSSPRCPRDDPSKPPNQKQCPQNKLPSRSPRSTQLHVSSAWLRHPHHFPLRLGFLHSLQTMWYGKLPLPKIYTRHPILSWIPTRAVQHILTVTHLLLPVLLVSIPLSGLLIQHPRPRTTTRHLASLRSGELIGHDPPSGPTQPSTVHRPVLPGLSLSPIASHRPNSPHHAHLVQKLRLEISLLQSKF